jgi:hypothetical protein
VSGLAAGLRAGGLLSAVLAFVLGALHALTPGPGKAALAAYFLGQDAKVATGRRVDTRCGVPSCADGICGVSCAAIPA